MQSNYRYYYKSLNSYKKAFWLYLVLIFIEGAMRKWFMVGMSSLWMMCREPIVIWTVLSLMNSKYLRSAIAKTFMVIGCIMFFTTMTFGHQNLSVAFFGFRIWFFHIPYIFIMANMLNREDIIRICKFLILVFMAMTILYVAQWASPTSAWINANIGGIVAEEGTDIVNGAVRPSGTFGHPVAASYYNSVVVSLFLVVLFSTTYRREILPFKRGYMLFTMAVVICLITSVSRGAVVQSLLTLVFISFVLAFKGKSKYIKQVLVGMVGIYVIFLVFSSVNIGGKNLMAPITDRFEVAAEQEGGSEGIMESRILEPYKFWNDKGELLDPPFFGYGIGAGSNFGTQTLGLTNFLGDTKAWGLGEWSCQIVTNEMGFLFGGIVFFLRMGLCVSLFFASLKTFSRKNDVLPLSLWTLSVPYFGNGNINLTMTLGWIVVVMILLIASIRTSEKIIYS